MAGGDLLGSAISGLLAFQRGLATAGHNISNVNTPGYSRQRVDFVTRPPTPAADGFIGNGVQVASVQRVYDGFIVGRLTAATSANGQLQEFYRLTSQVDNLLADPSAGLTPSVQRFFDAVNGVANDPMSASARQVLLSQAGALTDRFHYLDQRLSDLRQGVNTQLTNTVNEVNNIASGIAALNREIVLSGGAAGGQPPNDLLDQRDTLINQLAERVSVSTVRQDDGSINVFIGNGQTLVIGTSASKLSIVSDPYDATRAEVGYTVGGVTTIISGSLSGGTLGGVLDFRNRVLDPAHNALGRVAVGLASSFNAQHALGIDLNGNLGGAFFNAIDASSPRAISSRNNTGNAQLSASISAAGALTASDYRLDFDGANYTLTRLSDNTVFAPFAGFPQTFVSEGLTIDLAAGAALAGDSFLIQPTRTAAKDIAVAVGDASRIAAAAPLRAAAATDVNGLPTNAGTGTISAGSVSNTTNLPLAVPITLTFDPNAGGPGVPGFNVAGGPPGPLLYDPATEAAGKQFTFAGYGGVSFTVAGIPANGDSFVIGNNTTGASDNRNALALAGLRTQLTLANGTASYEGAYGQLVADVGIQAQRADVNRNAQQGLLNQITEARDAVSGVNLDEEAADLVRFQQAYQAAAQMIAVADTLFATLLNAVRR